MAGSNVLEPDFQKNKNNSEIIIAESCINFLKLHKTIKLDLKKNSMCIYRITNTYYIQVFQITKWKNP